MIKKLNLPVAVFAQPRLRQARGIRNGIDFPNKKPAEAGCCALFSEIFNIQSIPYPGE
ncbi:hypothetical protein ACPAVH_33445 [Enterobacteriaceae bacterium TYF_5]